MSLHETVWSNYLKKKKERREFPNSKATGAEKTK